ILSVIRQTMTLALVLEQYVSSLFTVREQELSDSERDELAGLFKYFNDHWMHRIFIDSIRKEVSTVHDLITQVNTGMQSRTK
ncbi:unnamed protein product, partial [Rotaria magnacalcarata]